MVKNESSGEETIVEIELEGLVRKLELLEKEIVKSKKVLKKKVNQMRKIKWNKKWNYGKGDRKKKVWKEGDRVMSLTKLTYRGDVDSTMDVEGIVTEVDDNMIWFKVLRPFETLRGFEHRWENGYSRRKCELLNMEWDDRDE